MTAAAGTRLGSYQIVAQIVSGGADDVQENWTFGVRRLQ